MHKTTDNGFYGLGIAPALLDILGRLKFVTPTPIQTQAIPLAIQGKDMVGIAQTGTGKTLAFGIPMIQRLAQVKGQGLVILPTRELALQVDEVLRTIGKSIKLRTAVLIGGLSQKPQVNALLKKPHIIVATPGRLIDHLNQKHLHLKQMRVVVLDEADRMLDMGFLPQIRRIIDELPEERQMMLFSATMPPTIMKLASVYMDLPVRAEIPPNRSLQQPRQALDGFKSGRYRVLVATEVASRGIDVAGIELVVNYDLPSTSDDYVHRIGRTARAGAGGHAISFAMPNQEKEVRAIERLIRKVLPTSEFPEFSKFSATGFSRSQHSESYSKKRNPRRSSKNFSSHGYRHRRFKK